MDLTNLNKDRTGKQRRKSTLDLGTMVYGKVPPQAKDLEEAVLGAIMLEKSAFDTVVEILKPECFYVEAHQRIFRAMQGLSNKSQPIDILTVAEELRFKEVKDIPATILIPDKKGGADVQVRPEEVMNTNLSSELIQDIYGGNSKINFSLISKLAKPIIITYTPALPFASLPHLKVL